MSSCMASPPAEEAETVPSLCKMTKVECESSDKYCYYEECGTDKDIFIIYHTLTYIIEFKHH